MRKCLAILLFCGLAACKTSDTESFSELHSDHIDGPATTEHAITDLTDFYVFPTPNKAGYISLVLNVHPLSRDHNHFSDKVNYTFFIRPILPVKTATPLKYEAYEGREITIDCSFATPEDHQQHTMTCSSSNGEKATNVFNNPLAQKGSSHIRAYHGLRADPFFFNASWAQSAASKGKLKTPKDSNIMNRTNCLSIVLDVDLTFLMDDDFEMFALAAQSYTMENGKFKALDRLGRPEVTNVTMVARGQHKDLRDSYNLETPFKVNAKNASLYYQRIVDNVANFDNLDGKRDWTQAKRENYAKIIVDDFLIIDRSKAAKGADYFAIEHAMLQGKKSDSFGGRALDNDIMDKLFGILINYNRGPVADGVNKPYKASTQSFPYLAEPDRSWAGWAKARAARWALGIQDNE